jgi:membrane protein implicated in regulation of membrane protease activity
VLLLVTVLLVLAGLVLLIIGFFQDNLTLIWLSIACAAVAGVALVVFSRLSRRRSLRVGSDQHHGPVRARDVGPLGAPAEPMQPQPTQRVLLGSGIRSVSADTDGDGADVETVRTPERRGRAGTPDRQPAVAASRSFGRGGREGFVDVAEPDELDDSDQTVGEDSEDELAPVASGSGRWARGETDSALGADDWGDEVIFPIEDYDDLRVGEILPLLPELEPDELEEVRDRESAGKNRSTILNRIDELFGRQPVEPWGVAPAAPVATAPSAAITSSRRAPRSEKAAKAKPGPAKRGGAVSKRRAAAPAPAPAKRGGAVSKRAAAAAPVAPAKRAGAVSKRAAAAAPVAPAKRGGAVSKRAAAAAPVAPAKRAGAVSKRAAAAAPVAPAKRGGAVSRRGAAAAPAKRAAASKVAPPPAKRAAASRVTAAPAKRAAASRVTAAPAKRAAAASKALPPAKRASAVSKKASAVPAPAKRAAASKAAPAPVKRAAKKSGRR